MRIQNSEVMKRYIKSMTHVNKALFVSILAGVGVALSSFYWGPQPHQKERAGVTPGNDYPIEWLGI